ncbi:Nramp family divalent metal transporter [Altererythrobacter sp. MF3-039]|uniref:Nramp family divalent metal transporter n=1 Tax=Altererythrobacter sp. MF3-039 TaxID=3252901 RepID=UPI00390CA608
MKRLGSIILWSAIAAAFIGPGTVTTAASAGAGFGLTLLWAVLFSVLATYVLQEAAARMSIATGHDLAATLRRRYPAGIGKLLVMALVPGAILLGCAAYEAGNILGGAAGALLAIDVPREAVTLAIGGMAAALLALGSPRRIAQAMAVLVAIMGAGFLLVALTLAPSLTGLARGLAIPAFPEGSGLIIIALIGTTVVPYNLFLGSSLAQGEDLSLTRLGLVVAIGFGGIITAAIVVVGSALADEFSFEALAQLLASELGEWARYLLALGLFAAGLSSAVTAPLAAALTARGLFGAANDPRWTVTSTRFRLVWLSVLAIGLGFGLADVRPAAAIILAQAFNGLLLPLIAMFLLAAVNDRLLMGDKANGPLGNLAAGIVTLVASGLGGFALWRVSAALIG